MNQQEIDRLWEKHSKPNNDFEPVWVVSEDDFTAAIQEATAQARREALEDYKEVVQALDDPSFASYSVFHHDPRFIAVYNRTFDVLEKHRKAIRALAAQEQEGKV